MQPIGRFLGSVGVVLSVGINAAPAADPKTVWWVSAPTLTADQQQHLTGFALTVTNASIRAIANVPKGWTITIDDDTPDGPQIDGNIQPGAAAVGKDMFRRFVAIRQQDRKQLPPDVFLQLELDQDRYIDVPQDRLTLSKESK